MQNTTMKMISAIVPGDRIAERSGILWNVTAVINEGRYCSLLLKAADIRNSIKLRLLPRQSITVQENSNV